MRSVTCDVRQTSGTLCLSESLQLLVFRPAERGFRRCGGEEGEWGEGGRGDSCKPSTKARPVENAQEVTNC